MASPSPSNPRDIIAGGIITFLGALVLLKVLDILPGKSLDLGDVATSVIATSAFIAVKTLNRE